MKKKTCRGTVYEVCIFCYKSSAIFQFFNKPSNLNIIFKTLSSSKKYCSRLADEASFLRHKTRLKLLFLAEHELNQLL